MLKAPDKKGPHSCEECRPMYCRSALGTLRRNPNSGFGMPSGIRNRYETSSPSILGLDSPSCLVGHLATSFLRLFDRSAACAVFLIRLLSYTPLCLNIGLFYKTTTTCSGYCHLVGTQLVPSWVPEPTCHGGAE